MTEESQSHFLTLITCVAECFCVYGKDFNIGDGSAQLRNLFDQVLTPPLQPRDEKYLLGENLDITDPCRFQLEVTMKPGPNGVPKLANAIFRFGIHPTSSNPQRFPRNVKLGGNGVFGKMRGSDVSVSISGVHKRSLFKTHWGNFHLIH